LAKASIIFHWWHSGSRQPKSFLVELFQIANSETSSMEIVWVTFAEAVVLLRLKVPKRSRTKVLQKEH
jgi:hypothetical protein